MRQRLSPAFLLFIGLFVAVEGISRAFFTRTLSGRFEYGYHPTAGFVENSDGSARLERAGGRRFFPQEFSIKKPKGSYRVMVVGDSVARGRNVVASYAGQLEVALGTQGVKAEGLNLGVPGYGARRKEITALQALEYDPDLLILHVNGSNEYEDEREWKRFQEFKSWHPRNWLMKSVIVRRLYEVKTEKMFWFWLPAKVRASSAVSDADAEVAFSMDETKLKAWEELVRKHTQSTVDTAVQKGVKVLLVTQGNLITNGSGEPTITDSGLDVMTEPMLMEGVARISMRQVLKDQPAFEELFADSSHLRQSGHTLLSEAIVAKLTQLKWLR